MKKKYFYNKKMLLNKLIYKISNKNKLIQIFKYLVRGSLKTKTI